MSIRSCSKGSWAFRHIFFLTFLILFSSSSTFAQGNGKLQIHFMDVGQGDAALLISPDGETVLFDNGVAKHCDLPTSYLQQLGITRIDYHIASHYHSDHIGCSSEVLEAFPLQVAAFDRGGTYPSKLFDRYTAVIGAKRKTANPGDKITLDTGSAVPVTVNFVALNGNGITTTNENDLSLVALIRFGNFDAVMGGDLSGYNVSDYLDIESTVADRIGQVEVYKVHHHCSRYSTNDKWLSVIKPKVGIISASATIGQNYGHPTEECLERLHKANVKTYWTEIGGGADPEQDWDTVGGNIAVEVEPGKDEFKVVYNWNKSDTYAVWGAPALAGNGAPKFAWSKRSEVYHHSNCKFVKNINPDNLEKGDAPPQEKRLHKDCPL